MFKVKIGPKEYAEKIIEIDLNNKKKDEMIGDINVLINEINVMQKISL